MKRGSTLFLLSLAIFLFAIEPALSKEIAPRVKQTGLRDLLPDELKQIDIADQRTKTTGDKPIGKIQTVLGPAIVFQESTKKAYFTHRGDALYQKDVLYTLAASRLRASFNSNDVVTLGANSRVSIDEYVDDSKRKEKRLVLNMHRGKSKVYVIPTLVHRSVHARVRTPRAVADVRGTMFGIEIDPGDTPDAAAPETFHCFDGTMGISSIEYGTSGNLETGESVDVSDTGMGDVENTDPAAADQFMAETDAPAPEEAESEEEPEETVEQEGKTDVTGQEAEEQEETEEEAAEQETPAEATETTSASDLVETDDITQTQSSEDTEDVYAPKDFVYFVAMLTTESNGVKQTDSEAIYRSESRGDRDIYYDSIARDSSTGNALVIDWSEAEPRLIRLESPSGNPITDGLPVEIEKTMYGINDYMEWGFWTQPLGMSDGIEQYSFNNRGYYFSGEYTADDQINALSTGTMTGTYNGKAYGTHFTPDGESVMSGLFRAKVDFSSGTLSDFDVSVKGCGHSATIFDASGSFSSTSPLSEFTIDGTSGQWTLDDIAADYGEAIGTMLGPGAEAIGGIWEMAATDDITDTVHQVSGMFQGAR